MNGDLSPSEADTVSCHKSAIQDSEPATRRPKLFCPSVEMDEVQVGLDPGLIFFMIWNHTLIVSTSFAVFGFALRPFSNVRSPLWLSGISFFVLLTLLMFVL